MASASPSLFSVAATIATDRCVPCSSASLCAREQRTSWPREETTLSHVPAPGVSTAWQSLGHLAEPGPSSSAPARTCPPLLLVLVLLRHCAHLATPPQLLCKVRHANGLGPNPRLLQTPRMPQAQSGMQTLGRNKAANLFELGLAHLPYEMSDHVMPSIKCPEAVRSPAAAAQKAAVQVTFFGVKWRLADWTRRVLPHDGRRCGTARWTWRRDITKIYPR